MSAETHFEKGLACLNEEDWEKAIEYFTTVIKSNSTNASAYANRGVAKGQLQQYQAAIEDYDQAIKINPEFAAAYVNRGFAKCQVEEFRAAMEDYNRATQLAPNNTKAFANRGFLKHQLKQYQAAIKDYDIALQLSPSIASLYFQRGNSKVECQQYQAAIIDLDKAIQLNPDDSAAYFNRGNARHNLGQYQAAIENFDVVIQLDPDYLQAYVNRGFARHRLGHHEAAIKDYNIALQLDPEDLKAYYNRGGAKYGLKQYEAALEDFDFVLQRQPDDAKAWESKAIVYIAENKVDWSRICFIRATYLGLNTTINLFTFFEQHPTAPFLTLRLLQSTPPEQYGREAQLIHTTFRQSNALYAFIAHQNLTREKNYTDSDWKKWLGIINYYMGDPIVSYQLLGDLVKEGSLDLMTHYYLIISCWEFAEDADPFIGEAIEICEKIKDQEQIKVLTQEQVIDYYYAGLIFEIDEEPEDALSCFSKVQNNFLPAAYRALLLWNQQGELEKQEALKQQIIDKEQQLGERGYTHGLKEHYLDFERDNLRQPFAHYFHYAEISKAIQFFANIAQAEVPFAIKAPYEQAVFYDLFKIHPERLEATRLRADIAPILAAWENQLKSYQAQTSPDHIASKQVQLEQSELAIRNTFRALQALADKENFEEEFGIHIQAFELATPAYVALLNYFYLKGHFTAYQKLLLHFYILDQDIRHRLPSKLHLAGMKDGVKKAIGEGLSILTGIVVGHIIPGLSVLSAIAAGGLSALGVSYAKGALGELFLNFYKTLSEPPTTYVEFKTAFEIFVASERERLGYKFDGRYPIDELE